MKHEEMTVAQVRIASRGDGELRLEEGLGCVPWERTFDRSFRFAHLSQRCTAHRHFNHIIQRRLFLLLPLPAPRTTPAQHG
jgi:hypothetical protein